MFGAEGSLFLAEKDYMEKYFFGAMYIVTTIFYLIGAKGRCPIHACFVVLWATKNLKDGRNGVSHLNFT